ncbi:MAG: hypothetical protein KDC98_01635 [Planctomycetes bacterium]|nr:hypothetical protein [Planctomycetota bacterium]
MVAMLVVATQALFTVGIDAGPVRFGVPLPAAAVARGLGLRGKGVLQWRRLPVGGESSDPVWVEIAIDGAAHSATVVAGGGHACPAGSGPACAYTREETVVPYGREIVDRWAWRSGAVDERVRLQFEVATTLDDETYQVGETRTRWDDPAHRCGRIASLPPPRFWQQAGVLPPGGRLGKRIRRHLERVRATLTEMPGERGAGDFVRSGEVVTNLEFDTTLGLLRLALATGDRAILAQGIRAASHLRDRDIDRRSGLPFMHGPDHRIATPRAGHAWLQGLLLAGLLTADDSMIEAAKSIARGLAASEPRGTGGQERARDFAWPLLEIEALLAIDPDPVLAAAADRLAGAIDQRFDSRYHTWRFGEGELGDGIYLERGWITGGVVIPALRSHLARHRDREMAGHLEAAQRELLRRIGQGRAGLPILWRCAGGRTFQEHRVERDPRAMLMLEGIAAADLRRLFCREEMRDCTYEVPAVDDPDLATAFSIVARCSWIHR